MDRVLPLAKKKQKDLIAFLRELVECESPSDDPASIARLADLFESRVGDIATCKRLDGGKYGPHLQCEFHLPGPARKDGQILALGHSDTVYSVGTLARMPFRSSKGRLWGPGVLDMKGGVAFFVFAMRILKELDIPVKRRVVLQLNSDEEVGSESSRPITEREARRSAAVLVLEPGQGLEGAAKTSRKGIGDYTVSVRGVASHAGVDFAKGASAILEVVRQIQKIATFSDLTRGITVNPGVIHGGSRSNVVADFATTEVDFRVPRLRDAEMLEKKFRSLKPFDKRCTIEVAGGLNRPPMERSKGVAALYGNARAIAAELGVDLKELGTGGGSDGNFTAALGVPTLDGIGAVGEGAHSSGESILIDRIADRMALLARMVAEI